MGGLEKEARKVVEQAKGTSSSKSSGGKKASGDTKKKKGKGSGADKAKRAAKELLK
jgi:hypothetical protein